MLLGLIDPKSRRIHTTYEQTTAATGRLSSSAPNLQNIPIRGDLGRQIRRAFVAPPGHVLLSADYSQIELRVLAHLSEDETFCQAFAQGHDFHATIAAKVYGVGLSDVTSEMRNQVKQFSYGIAYGMSTYGVSQRLGVEMDEAASFRRNLLRAVSESERISRRAGGESKGRRLYHDHVRPAPLSAGVAVVKFSPARIGRAHGAQRADPGKRRRHSQESDDRRRRRIAQRARSPKCC